MRPVLDRAPCSAEMLRGEAEDFTELRRSEGSGRPVGAPDFVMGLERLLGRKTARRVPWRKPASSVASNQLELIPHEV